MTTGQFTVLQYRCVQKHLGSKARETMLYNGYINNINVIYKYTVIQNIQSATEKNMQMIYMNY